MSHIFISHSEKDFHILNEINKGLEDAGYLIRYFEGDTLPRRPCYEERPISP